MEKVSNPFTHRNNDVVVLSADDDIYTMSKSINKAKRLFLRVPLLVYGATPPINLRIK